MAEAFVILVNIVQDYCFGPYACKRHVIYVLAIWTRLFAQRDVILLLGSVFDYNYGSS